MSEHPGDALSALLDGQLGAEEAEVVHAHVVGCGECAAELDAVRHARVALRSLPAIEPPLGFLDGFASREPAGSGPTRRETVRWVPQAAAAVVLGLVFVVSSRGVEPASAVSLEVTGQVEQHAATVSAVSAGLGGPDPILAPDAVTPTTTPRWSATELPRPYRAPATLAGYRLRHAFRADGGVHLLYENGPYALSVFQRRGWLDTSELSERGESMRIRGRDAWRWDGGMAAGRVLVLQQGSVVVTLVGDESGAVVRAAAEAFPGPAGPSLATRLRRACGDALEMLSPAA